MFNKIFEMPRVVIEGGSDYVLMNVTDPSL